MNVSDDFDQRAALRLALPSYGPNWEAAIEFGIDVSLLEANLKLSVEQRLEQLDQMTRLYEELRPKVPPAAEPATDS